MFSSQPHNLQPSGTLHSIWKSNWDWPLGQNCAPCFAVLKLVFEHFCHDFFTTAHPLGWYWSTWLDSINVWSIHETELKPPWGTAKRWRSDRRCGKNAASRPCPMCSGLENGALLFKGPSAWWKASWMWSNRTQTAKGKSLHFFCISFG